MCGIVGYIGSRQSTDVLLDGLSKLEYRGYDSAGVALCVNDEIRVVKAQGRLAVLAEKLNGMPPMASHCGIGHTRWATHGAPSDVNSHPHCAARVSLVHNGIIENYAQLKEHLMKRGYEFCSETDTEVLVKLLDSGIRLPMQCHPDREFAKRYFHSEYGKAEMWIVVATRENAKLFLGFNKKMNQEEFTKLVERSLTEKECMTECVNEIPVKKGDAYLIPGRTIHAIGYGCLILEIQEPSDLSVCPEYWCGDRRSAPYEMYMDLEPEIALKCFDYTLYGDAPVNMARKLPRVKERTEHTLQEIIVNKEDTPFFAVNRVEVNGGTLSLTDSPAVYVITEGEGVLHMKDGYEKRISKGDYFLLPRCLEGLCGLEASEHLEAYVCMPPM